MNNLHSTTPDSRSVTGFVVMALLAALSGACGRTTLLGIPSAPPSPDARELVGAPDGRRDADPHYATPDLALDLSPLDTRPIADASSPVDLPREAAKPDVRGTDGANERGNADTVVVDAKILDARLADTIKADTGKPEVYQTPAKLESFPGGFSMDRLAGTKAPPFDVTVTNVGGTSTGILRVEVSGAGAAVFEIPDDTCSNRTLAPAATCKITTLYVSTATTNTLDVATLRITDTASQGSFATVSMSGNTVVR